MPLHGGTSFIVSHEPCLVLSGDFNNDSFGRFTKDVCADGWMAPLLVGGLVVPHINIDISVPIIIVTSLQIRMYYL